MDDEWKQRLATNLRQLMTARGWSQSDLARAAGMGTDNISRYLSARYVPSAKHLAKIADAFGVQPTDLYGTHDDEGAFLVELHVLREDPSRSMLKIRHVLPTEVAMEILALVNKARTQANQG